MLRRRIFSSAMASVMALSTVAVVAQAEETKAVKTEAELDALVNGEAEGQCGSAWRTSELLDYGSAQTENMLGALDAAEAILDSDESTEDDYTVAWYMVTGVRESLKKYTYDDLQKLIKKAEPKFAKNNIYNEELNDNIYTTDSYAALESAYGDATTYTETSLVPDITDAYVALEKALKDLTELNKVTKAEFRAVMNEYEAILADAYKYDSWRRGTGISGLGPADNTSFGYVYDFVYAMKEDINEQYNKLDAIKGLNVTTDIYIRGGYDLALKAIKFYKSWTPDADVRGSSAAVKKLLNQYNGVLVYDFAADILGDKEGTTEDSLMEAIRLAIGDEEFGKTTFFGENGKALWSVTLSAEDQADNWAKFQTITAAEAVVKLTKTVYVPVDKDGKWTGDVIQTTKPKKATVAKITAEDDPETEDVNETVYAYKKGDWILDDAFVADGTAVVSYKMLSANSKFDLADYIKINIAAVAEANLHGYQVDSWDGWAYGNGQRTLDQGGEPTNGWNSWDTWSSFAGLGDYAQLDNTVVNSTQVDLETALVIADAYMNGVYANIKPTSTDAKTLAKQQDQNTAFVKYAGYLGTAVDNVGDAGLTTNLKGQEDDPNTAAVEPTIAPANDIVDVIDETGAVATAKDEDINGKAKGHTTEWTMVYRYLQYALADRYDAAAQSEGAKYTKADVSNLIAKATELIDDTGDAAIFNVANVALVEARQDAREWLADANSDRLYKEYTAGTGADGDDYVASTAAYIELNTAYDNLLEEYEALKLSFEDVYKKIAETAAAIDNGDLDDSAELQDAIKAVAAALNNIDDVTYAYAVGDFEADGSRLKEKKDAAQTEEYLDNAAFNELREFLAVNRVVTGRGQIAAMNNDVVDCNDKQNPTHKALVDALAALDKAIEKATEPEVVVVAGDYTGEGKVSLADAAAILTDYTAGTLDQTKGDYNGDGKTSLADAAAILTAFTNGEL